MAPIKRRSHLISDEESDDDMDGSVPDSDTRPSSRKRRRNIEDAVVLGDSPSDHSPSDEEPTRPTSLGSEDEDGYEHLATQAIREKHAGNADNIAAECGILEKVHVVNFMCHKNYEFELGPLINFVCGKNGSGKSAILTAIVLCLGGKASATNRGQALKSFIREGSESGYIIVHIKNQGDGAYMPDEYGGSIIVERYFNRAGASGFKIKSARGRLLSTKKSDLDEICDHFSLQIENPLNVLSQDMARKFITTSSAAEKYKFFVRGVQLEQLDQDYRVIEDYVDNIEAKIDMKRPDVEILKQKKERAEQRKAASEAHDGMLDKIRDLRRQLAWVQIEDQERVRDQYISSIEEANTKIAEEHERLGRLGTVFEEADQASSEAMEAHQQATAQVTRVQEEKETSKERHDEVKRALNEAQNDQRNVRGLLQESTNTINKRKSDIEEEEQRLADLDGGGGAARLRALEDAKDAVKDAYGTLEAHQGRRLQLERDVQTTKLVMEDHEKARTTQQENFNNRKRILENFTRDRNEQDRAFDANLPNLLRAIDSERGFAQRPVGPVGKHVRLLKPEWSSIIEKSFGGSLNSFIVTSKSDMNILSGIMSRVRCRLPIIIGNNLPLDTTSQEPDANFDTVLRALEIDNDLVRKQLVIQHGIEQTILITDLEEASKVLYDQERPRNVKRCYCIDRNNRRRGFMLSFTRNGEASQDPMHEWQGRPRMRTDVEAQLQLQQEALQQSRIQLRKVEEEYRTRQNNHEKAKQALNKHQREERDLRIAFQQAEDEVERLQEAIQEDNIEGGKLEVLRSALSEAEDSKALYEGQYEDSVVAVDTRKDELKVARRELARLDEQIAELQHIAKRAEGDAQKLSKRRALALGEKNTAVERIKDGEQDRASLQRKLDDLERNIENYTAQANEISARVNIPEGETTASIQKKHDRMRADYQKHQERIGGSREQIAAEAASTAEAYKNSLKQLRGLEELGLKLKGSLIERRERWKKFRSFIAVRAKANFTYLLSERSFRGKLITDHNQKLLEVSVEPDITKRDGSGRGARTLSGGEKSFSQICLLLSIWEAMGSPIRCLDEFDVFMDAVNRSSSVSLLVDAARRSVGRQFILISPGTKSDIKQAADVNVQELQPPARDQRTLDEFRAR